MDRDEAAAELVTRVIETGEPHSLYRVDNEYEVHGMGEPPEGYLEGTSEPLVLGTAVRREHRRER